MEYLLVALNLQIVTKTQDFYNNTAVALRNWGGIKLQKIHNVAE